MEFSKAMKIGAGITCGGCVMLFLIVAGLYYLGKHGGELAKARVEGRKQVPTWQYNSLVDPMDSSTTKTAILESTNLLTLGFPYQGEQPVALIIRDQKRGGTNVILAVHRGQINMSGINGGSVLVRFDDNPPQQFGINQPSDRASTSAFMQNTAPFLAELKTAKKTLIQIEFFNNGSHTMEFNTVGFKWE